jgi:hypothetical protein
MNKTENLGNDVQLLALAVQVGMLKHACQAALELLQDPDADQFNAHKVEKLLNTALRGIE